MKILENARARKYSAREGFRLMGVKENDFAKIKDEFTYRQLMHFAGDSIVTTCLMAIFGELCGVEYEEKIRGTAEAVREKGEKQ